MRRLRNRGYEIEGRIFESNPCLFGLIMVEGINDPHILKAIFTAGGPGSGKTYISDQMVKGLGLKAVNSDEPLERYLKRESLPLIMQPDDPDMYAKQLVQREKAKEVAKKAQRIWEKGLLGLLIDGTAKDASKIIAAKNRLQELGYDVAMIYVDTPLQMALDANARRGREGGRTVDPEVATSIWKGAQKNRDIYANAFGQNFFLIDRGKTGRLEGSEEQAYGQQLRRIGMRWLSRPLENPIGKAIISRLREIGGKTRDDLPQNFKVAVGESRLRARGYLWEASGGYLKQLQDKIEAAVVKISQSKRGSGGRSQISIEVKTDDGQKAEFLLQPDYTTDRDAMLSLVKGPKTMKSKVAATVFDAIGTINAYLKELATA